MKIAIRIVEVIILSILTYFIFNPIEKPKFIEKVQIVECKYIDSTELLGDNIIKTKIDYNLYSISGDITSRLCIGDYLKGLAVAVYYRPYDTINDYQLVDVELYADDGFYYTTLHSIVAQSNH